MGLLKSQGFTLSIDTLDPVEIVAADRAGIDYVLSLNGQNLDVAARLRATPVLIPDSPAELDTLDRSMAHLETLGRPYIVDPVIEPVGFGFAAALDRYVQVRARHPAVEILMGIGNITELTDADTTGMNALLIGFCQELGIRHVLTTEVIPWARGAVREVDVARRLMYAARRRGVLPKHIDDRLLTVKDARPKYYTEAELRALHRAITDPNFRIATTRDAICVFNNRLFVMRDGHPGPLRAARRRGSRPRVLPRQGAHEGAPGAAPREDLRAGAAAPLGVPDAGARGHAPPPRADRGAPAFAKTPSRRSPRRPSLEPGRADAEGEQTPRQPAPSHL